MLLIPVLQLGMAHELNSEFDLALAEFERAEGLIGNESFRQLFIAVVAMELGDRALIEDALNKVLDAGDLPANINKVNSTMLSLMDQPEAARMELHRFAGDPGFNLPVLRAGIAVWSSYVGDRELALRIYRDLYVGGELDIFAIWRPIEKDMRRLPGFKETLRDIGLVDYWRSTGNWNDFCRRVGHSDCGCE